MRVSLKHSSELGVLTEPCDTCADPEHCLGFWPDDDPHKPGRQRGCFRASATSVAITDAAPGKTLNGKAASAQYNSWEKGRVGEHRPGGTFMPYLDPKTDMPMTQKRYSEGGRELVEKGRETFASRFPSNT